MILLRALKLARPDDRDLQTYADELLEGALRILRAGVVRFTPQDWAEMTEEEQDALVRAGDRLRAEEAQLLVSAFLSPEFRRELARETLGPAGVKELARLDALEALAARTDEVVRKFLRRPA